MNMINGETKSGTSNPANPLDARSYAGKPEENSPDTKDLLYSPEQKDYASFVQSRLENGKRQKNQVYPEYNNKNYYQIYNENERIANTMLEPKKNDDDVIVSAGTIEAKLDALLANINNLDLSADIFAFDKENNKIQELGEAMEDIIDMTEELDGEGSDEEKKLLRQRELLKQGTVFVQEEWLKLWETKKKLTEGYDGQFKDWKNWEESLELVFDGPSRTLLYGPNVYLGNTTEFFMDKQPFVFVVIHQDYKVAETKYGKFENWKHVVKGAVPSDTAQEQRTIFDNKWRLTEITADQVEIILYQDKPRDEFQIFINGVMMLPVGFPLSAVCPGGNYNIAKQVFRVINHKFAYGKSFVSSGAVKELSALVDEMLKLFVLKTRKSVTPAYVNTSGKVIPKKVLSPGRISMGIAPDALQPIGNEGQGVTSSEYQILKELQDEIDKSTVSNQFAGQQGHAGTTATEVVELQRQSKLVLGLTIAACGLLEKKLAYLRLWNILENWFNPVDTKVIQIGDVRKEVKQYRNTHSTTNIDGAGMGERYVIPTDQGLPDAKTIRDLEIKLEKEKGFPIRRTYIDPEALKTAKLRWYVVINPRERETSAFYKLLFREELADMLTLTQFGSIPNRDGLEEKFSMVYKENRNKLFKKEEIQSLAGVGGMSPEQQNGGTPPAPKGRANTPGVPLPNAVKVA